MLLDESPNVKYQLNPKLHGLFGYTNELKAGVQSDQVLVWRKRLERWNPFYDEGIKAIIEDKWLGKLLRWQSELAHDEVCKTLR